jgi:Zn-dependent peptidase ImmA (M78 family)
LIEFPKLTYDLQDGWTPESVAARIREVLGFERDEPITNIITKIEELGVIVFFYDSSHRKFDGLTSYTDNGVPVIFVNKNMPNDRIKFTVVHEFFHLIMHLPCQIEPWRDVESEANIGTSNFYLPSTPMLNDLLELSYNKLSDLKAYWGVSKAAIIRRAKDLGLITIETYKYLNEELGRRGEKPVEHGFVELERPKLISTIINLLRNDAGYSAEALANKLLLNQNDYSLFFEPNIGSAVKLKVLHRTA